jgi:hypothetical protein
MRGESIKSRGWDQWPANAQLLSDHHEYCGPDFSYGDKYIYELGEQLDRGIIEKTGNPETWLRAGINHHITFVYHQIASLPGPLIVDEP